MWLILTEPYDDNGAWLAQGLRPHAPGPVVHLTTRDITQGASTAHGCEDGNAWFHVRVASGQTIDSRSLRGVVNRVCALPPGLAFRLSLPLRDSAERNFGLPLLHLLHGFDGPVLNRPTAQGISGDFRIDFEWSTLATQVGFVRTPSRPAWSNRRTAASEMDVTQVLVIGEQTIAPDLDAATLPTGVAACCRRLAALSRTSMLGLELTRDANDDWHFLRANSRASLRPGGERALAAVAQALTAPPAPIPAIGTRSSRGNPNSTLSLP